MQETMTNNGDSVLSSCSDNAYISPTVETMKDLQTVIYTQRKIKCSFFPLLSAHDFIC